MKRRSFLIGACSLVSIPLIERVELIAKPIFFDMGANSYEDEPFPHFARGDYKIISAEELFEAERGSPYAFIGGSAGQPLMIIPRNELRKLYLQLATLARQKKVGFFEA